jgi:hypothetical protein
MNDQPATSSDLIAEVAAILDLQQFRVKVHADVAGMELDIVAERGDKTAQRRLIVECKAYTRLVGLRTVRSFGATYQYLHARGLADEARLVTTSGFTPYAQRAAEYHGVDALTLQELRRSTQDVDHQLSSLVAKWRELAVKPGVSNGKKRVFVVMPFDEAMLDVYVLGIRWVAERLGLVVARADDLQHNGDQIEEIQASLRAFDAVVADTTGANPNVCYEVGYAHAAATPTVLICRKGEKLPFDLQGVNHIIYPTIQELRARLGPRLRATLIP